MAALARFINGQTLLASVTVVMTILTKKAPDNWAAAFSQAIMTVSSGAAVWQLKTSAEYLKVIVTQTGAINAI